MRNRFLSVAAVLLSAVALSGCLAPKSFVDPSFAKVSYGEIRRSAAPLRLKLVVEFQRNGSPFPRGDTILKDNSERVLRASGTIVPAADAADGEIRIVVNNIADIGEAMRKGFGTGLTFGASGSSVIDAYEASVTINARGRTFSRTAVRHAIVSTIGNTPAPAGAGEALTPDGAFERVLEQILLRVLKEMQASGELSSAAIPRPADADDLAMLPSTAL